MSIDIFSNQTCRIYQIVVLIYSNQDNNAKKYQLPKGFIKNYYVIIDRRKFYYQPIDSDIKRYKEIRKLTTRKSEDYNTECNFRL